MPRALSFLVLTASLLVSGAFAAEKPEATDPSHGTVVVTLAGSLELRPAMDLFGRGEESLHEATVALRSAFRADETTVVLDLSQGFGASLATAEELAATIRTERAANPGQRVLCFVDDIRDSALVVAATCDEVVMASAGVIDVHGVGFESYYFADALAKVGVRFHAVASGDHKTAHEPFTRTAPSVVGADELRELANGLDVVLANLSVRDALTREALAKARSVAPQTPEMAKSTGLVDTLAEPGAWFSDLPEPLRYAGDERKHPDLSGMAGMMLFWQQLVQGDRKPRHTRAVAVMELSGDIMPGSDSVPGETICPGDTCDELAELADDERIVAVVLRMDSPGGDAGASDRIHHAVRRLAEVKPVVALFESVAASGGYYIGCAADEIQVHRATITGSIGVFALVPDASAAMDLLGVHRFSVSSSPRADVMSLTAPFSEERRRALEHVIVDVDQRFQALVADNRDLDPAVVEKLAGGRIFTGEQAVANGLADGFGTIATAVAAARARAKIDETLPVERFPRNRGLFGRLGVGGVQAMLPRPLARLQRLSSQAADGRVRVMAWANAPVPR